MIVELILAPLWALISVLIGFLPSSWFSTGDTPTQLFSMLYTAFQFFPSDVWVTALGCIIFWAGVHFVWALINFILRLIPFLNMGQS